MTAILFSHPKSRILVIVTLSVKSIVCIHLKFFIFQIFIFPLSSALTTIGVRLIMLKQVIED